MKTIIFLMPRDGEMKHRMLVDKFYKRRVVFTNARMVQVDDETGEVKEWN